MDGAMSPKDFINKLYVEEVEGTQSLYAKTGFSMRMEMWDEIKIDEWIELSVDCNQNVAGSREKAMIFYDTMIERMNVHLQSMDPHSRGQLLFNRNAIQERFSNDPVQFVHAMADSFEQEKQLISRNKNQIELQDLDIEHVTSIVNTDNITQSEQFIENFRCILEKLNQYSSVKTDFGLVNPIPSVMVPTNLVQEALAYLEQLSISLQNSDQKIKELIGLAVQADALRSVNLTPHHSISYEDVSPICDRYALILDKLHRLLHQTDPILSLSSDRRYLDAKQMLKQLIGDFLTRNMVFTKHPKNVILVTNAKEKQVEKEVKTEPNTKSTSSKGKRGQKTASKEKSKVYDTKKKEVIDAKVSILGISKFSKFQICSQTLSLATEQQLASPAQSPQRMEPGFIPQSTCGTIYPPPTELPRDGEIEFKSLKIVGYERANDSVYEQLVRLQYTLEIQAFNENYTLKAFSQPFFLCTGAIQVLELLGSRMWYLANKPDLYHGDFQVISHLLVDDVINMLENCIKSTCPNRRRGLTYYGRQFLRERIPEIDSQGKVSLHTFIKDKMKKVPNDRTTETTECYKFTFFAWFYAFVKTLQKDSEYWHLWHDGIIYDLFTFCDAQEFMLSDEIPSKCIILRPGLSKIYKPNSLEAHIRFTADMKFRSGGRWQVASIPIQAESLEKSSLYSIISNITVDKRDDLRPQSIYTRKGIQPLDILKPENGSKGSKTSYAYRSFEIECLEVLSITTKDSHTSLPEEDDNQTSVRLRKKAREDSTCSMLEPPSSVESPSVGSIETRLTDTDYLEEMVSPSSEVSSPDHQNFPPPNDFNQVDLDNRNWTKFGGHQVDISKVKTSHLSSLSEDSGNVSNNQSPDQSHTSGLIDGEIMESEYPQQTEFFIYHDHVIQQSTSPSPPESTNIPTTVQEIGDNRKTVQHGDLLSRNRPVQAIVGQNCEVMSGSQNVTILPDDLLSIILNNISGNQTVTQV